MSSLLDAIPKLPVADGVENFTSWLTDTFAFLFDPIQKYSEIAMEFVTETLLLVPPLLFILIVAVIAFSKINYYGWNQPDCYVSFINGRYRFNDWRSWSW